MFKSERVRYAVIAALVITVIFLYIFIPSCIGVSAPQSTATFDEATIDEILDITTTQSISEATAFASSPSTVNSGSSVETTIPRAEHATKKSTKNVVSDPIEKPIEVKPPAKSELTTSKKPTMNAHPSKSDVQLLARVIYLEGGCCSEYCQWLIGSAAMNLADERGGLAKVAYDYNTFNVAYLIDGCTPSSLSISVAERILSGDRDYRVKAFRTNYYHSFGTPYTNVDNVYFSTY